MVHFSISLICQGLRLILTTHFSVGKLKMSPGALIANFLIKWNLESYVLLRIRVIMGILTILYLMFFFSSLFFTRIYRSMVNFLDPVADATLVYIMGAMQAAPLNNQLFPVWALILVGLRSSIHGRSSSGMFFELRNVLKLLVVAYMNLTRGSKLWRFPFWFFWGLLVLQCFYKILARHIASKSLWNGRSSELLQEYMGANVNKSNFNPEICNPETMEGYKYLVYGELQKSRKSAHILKVEDLKSLVTLDKIWRCDSALLLTSINMQGNNMKDMALAFALSRLLRCRLEGATLHEATVYMTRKLISKRILSDSAEKELFGILELDVSFLRDSLHSSYPMVFCRGLLSLFFTLLLSLAKFWMVLWLVRDVNMTHIPKSVREGGPWAHLSYLLHSFGYDLCITFTAVNIVTITEFFRMINYFLSKWAKLIAMCNFVKFRNRWLKYVIVNMPAKHGERTIFMRQHVFLQPFSSSMSVWKLISCILERNQNAITVPSKGKMNASTAKNVKAVVIQALRSMDLEGHPLSRNLPLPRVSDRAERYWLACLAEVPTCSRVILVWHIATSLCEIKLANDQKINLTKMSRLSSFLVDEKTLTDELQKAYTVSNCLSRYCMYLLASKPKLLPDTILMSKKAFHDAVQCAHEMLSDCHSFQSIYNKLMEKEQKALVPSKNGLNLSGNILQQGAILANALINEECQECRWEILSDVWVHLLVHIAPSSDTAALAEDLKSGVEFITVIWALFCHYGIEKSELWQQQKSENFRNNTPGPSNQSSDVSTHVQDTVSSSPPATQSSEIHVEASPTSELNFSGNDHIRKPSIQSVL
ncbi:uncharacterized protein LOC127755810 [Oryza glaberrima]|uniref:uncharacterized protein LOC127755810 n=1 Tax=Oryza glaberrima TaxID=4538 RepID=UPI00224C1FA9|nr:uncharacterized protein LOC127755810 [Oryza glaberrima]